MTPDQPTVSDGGTELDLGRWVSGGACIAHAEGKTWFVRFGIPGERVRVVVTRRARGVVYADVTSVISPSPARTDPACRSFGPGLCGGCDLQHVSLEEQRRSKRDVVVDCLTRLGGMRLDHLKKCVTETTSIPGDAGGLGWRTRMTALRTVGGIGMHRARSHEVVEVTECPITDNRVLPSVMRDVRPGEEFRAAIGSDGIVRVEAQGGSARVREAVTTLVGTESWSLPVGAFWQVHGGFAQYLGDTVVGLAGSVTGETWWDLYAGAGLLTAFLADAGASRVVSVESDGRACSAARRTFHNRPDVVLHHAEVAAWLADQAQPPHGVVVDPPRSGCGPEVTRQLMSLPVPRIIYVACDPAALARDVRILRSGGYEVQRVVPIDAFPMTHHVETVALLAFTHRLS